MEFNSFAFLFVFLPLILLLFWIGRGVRWRMGVLAVGSYVFYFYWDYFNGWRGGFTALMIGSTSVNYFAGKRMSRLPAEQTRQRKLLLIGPILVNLSLLAAFKYAMFGYGVVNQLVGRGWSPLHVILPIGISFFTFEAISYITDIYRRKTQPAPSFLEYCCFISMFPRQIAGPIVRYSDLEAQFTAKRETRWAVDWSSINVGLLLLTMGMVKKVLVADRIAAVINPIWHDVHDGDPVSLLGYWAAVLGYTFQIYFDFSGYSDMAVGLAHVFGLKLPQNFDSPYTATDASDFWRRWHITLSCWLRDYLYIPLGGNRTGHRTRNLLITMLLGGLWHGANWQFLLWGGWHGGLLVVYHQLRERKWMPADTSIIARFFNRQIMFALVIVGWVAFRAPTLRDAGRVYAGLFRPTTGKGPLQPSTWFFVSLLACWLWCNLVPNSFKIAYGDRPRLAYAALAGVMLAVCVFYFGSKSDFLYFQF